MCAILYLLLLGTVFACGGDKFVYKLAEIERRLRISALNCASECECTQKHWNENEQCEM